MPVGVTKLPSQGIPQTCTNPLRRSGAGGEVIARGDQRQRRMIQAMVVTGEPQSKASLACDQRQPQTRGASTPVGSQSANGSTSIAETIASPLRATKRRSSVPSVTSASNCSRIAVSGAPALA